MANYCNYKDCENIHRAFTSKVFFNLPTDSRRDIWIKNSGNDKLKDLGPSVRRVFCEDHFDPKYLRRQFNRTILRREAVPYSYGEVPEPQQIECIELAESEEETDQRNTIDNETKNMPNNDVIVLNQAFVRIEGIPSELIFRECKIQKNIPENTDDTNVTPDKSPTPEPESNVQDDEEVDFIVLEEDSQEPIENDINEIDQSSSKRICLEVEYESSQQVKMEKIVKEDAKHPEKPNATVAKANIDGVVSSSETVDSNSEETYFALSLVGILKRLPPHKRAIAKCHILSYLTELEYGSSKLS